MKPENYISQRPWPSGFPLDPTNQRHLHDIIKVKRSYLPSSSCGRVVDERWKALPEASECLPENHLYGDYPPRTVLCEISWYCCSRCLCTMVHTLLALPLISATVTQFHTSFNSLHASSILPHVQDTHLHFCSSNISEVTRVSWLTYTWAAYKYRKSVSLGGNSWDPVDKSPCLLIFGETILEGILYLSRF